MKLISAQKKSTVISLIWLLIYLSVAPMSLSNYVLCVGADGHVEFEIAVDGQCTDTHISHEEHAEVAIAAATVEEKHCGSCFDLAVFVPLDTAPYLIPVQSVLIHPPASVITLVVYRSNDSTILIHTPLLDIPSIVAPTLISLRTTTLLI